MNTRFRAPLFAIVALSIAALPACGERGSGGPAPTPAPAPTVDTPAATPGISLRVLPPGDTGEVRVEVRLDVAQPSARVMELDVKHTGALQYLGAAKGPALDAAGKDLIVQHKTPDVARVIALSGSNADVIGSGLLLTLRFAATGGGPIRFEVLGDNPIFAPPQANAGLRVSDPVEVRL